MTRLEKLFFEAKVSPQLYSQWNKPHGALYSPEYYFKNSSSAKKGLMALVITILLIGYGPQIGPHHLLSIFVWVWAYLLAGTALYSIATIGWWFINLMRYKLFKGGILPHRAFLRDCVELERLLHVCVGKLTVEKLEKMAYHELVSIAHLIIEEEKYRGRDTKDHEQLNQKFKQAHALLVRFELVKGNWTQYFEAAKVLQIATEAVYSF